MSNTKKFLKSTLTLNKLAKEVSKRYGAIDIEHGKEGVSTRTPGIFVTVYLGDQTHSEDISSTFIPYDTILGRAYNSKIFDFVEEFDQKGTGCCVKRPFNMNKIAAWCIDHGLTMSVDFESDHIVKFEFEEVYNRSCVLSPGIFSEKDGHRLVLGISLVNGSVADYTEDIIDRLHLAFGSNVFGCGD